MIRLIMIIIIAWLGLAQTVFAADSKPAAQHGELHLENWDFGERGSVALDGEWAFYWRNLLVPGQFQSGSSFEQTGWITLPGSWNNYPVGQDEKLSSNGYATVRLTIYTGQPDRKLSLDIPTMFTAYKLWINGELTAEAGEVGMDRESMVPAGITHIADLTSQNGRIDLLLQVSNFYHLRGGVTKSLELGLPDQIDAQSNKSLAFEMFVIGVLIVMGIYHLALYYIRRKDKAPLYFGIFSIIWGIRGLLVGHVMWTMLFPDFPWELQIKMEYSALFGGMMIFVLYQKHLFPGELPNWLVKVSVIAGIVQCAFVCVMPAIIYTPLLPYQEILMLIQIGLMLYYLVQAWRHRKEGSRLLVLFAVFMMLTVINDFLFYAEILPIFGDLSTFGFLVFTVGQVVILSQRFGGSFGMVETYSELLEKANIDLKELNENLEMKVQSRNQELQESNARLLQSNEEIKRVERSRKLLLSYISHDLRNEMTVIMGYTEAISDKVRVDLHDRFVELIHHKVIDIDHMIDDLNFLSQLESGQRLLRMKPVRIAAFMQNMYIRHDSEVTDHGLQFQFMFPEAEDEDEEPIIDAKKVNMDADQLERVLANLIQNAVKFTPNGGQITLGYDLVDGDQIEIVVADTGVGIPEEDLPHIFDHYFRGQHGQAGSGLGLAICKEIVERHSGRVWAESAIGAGSRFCVRLPLM